MASVKQRACEQCSRLKAKCTWDTDCPSCRRCQRLKRECIVPEWRPKKKRGKSTRVEAIEQKIDDMMMLLNKTQQDHNTDRETLLAAEERDTPSARCFEGTGESVPPTPVTVEPCLPPPLPANPSEQSIALSDTFRITYDEADRILNHYKTERMSNFPFVLTSVSRAKIMLQRSPMLLRAILYSCREPSWPNMADIEQSVRQSIALRVVVHHEKTLDVLQAILVFVAWNGLTARIKGKDTSLLHLACDIVEDLGLNRSCSNQMVPFAVKTFANENTRMSSGVIKPREITKAEKRAFIGVVYVKSMVWNYLRRSEPLGCLDHVEELCAELIKTDEAPTDRVLVALARIQSFMVKLSTLSPPLTKTGRATARVPSTMILSIMGDQLAEILEKIPWTVKSKPIIRCHYFAALQRLYEVAANMTSTEGNLESLQRTQALWNCCQNARTVVDMWLSVPPKVLSAMPFAFFVHFSLANEALTHILFLQDPEWVASTARESIDYAGLLQGVIDRLTTFEALEEFKEVFVENSVRLLPKLVEILRQVKDWYVARQVTISVAPDNATRSTVPSIPRDEGSMPTFFSFGKLDDI